ncbi:Carboxypeptidase Y A [Venturia nashicola]|uniref:Carboxypeptidase Y A n=1 Tax=Venturia nashicola TaxID=86259 RepID=A0A4Z1PMC1_9PEZI|nr:Carboxypeptidase Y A [Venturia nashicola]
MAELIFCYRETTTAPETVVLRVMASERFFLPPPLLTSPPTSRRTLATQMRPLFESHATAFLSSPPQSSIQPSAPRDDPRSIDSDWVHDRYDDDESELHNETAARRRPDAITARGPRRGGGFSGRGNGRRDQDLDLSESGSKIRVDNLHYDLTDEDLRDLFGRQGTVSRVQLLYDRNDRSRGIGYVTMPDSRDARAAVREYDGANANGQPIRVTLMQPATAAPSARNPFDTAERPTRSLFDRIERPSGTRARSESPDRSRRRVDNRRSDVSKPAPENIDRYVPGGGRSELHNDSRRRSPRRGEGRRGDRAGRRPGERRRRSPAKDEAGHVIVQGRPRKTQEELDAEMADYWNKQEAENGNGAPSNGGLTIEADGDVDMIE